MSGPLRTVFGIGLAIVLLALGVYGLQNAEYVRVYVLFWTFRGTQAWVPAGLFALLIFFICLLYGLLSGTLWHFRHRRLIKVSAGHQTRAQSLTGELEEARAEIARLRQAADRRPVRDALRTDAPDADTEGHLPAGGPS
ncbi:MAG: hypothetical protein ACREQM_07595 [Candidatus Dormibacteraceae bacterium]